MRSPILSLLFIFLISGLVLQASGCQKRLTFRFNGNVYPNAEKAYADVDRFYSDIEGAIPESRTMVSRSLVFVLPGKDFMKKMIAGPKRIRTPEEARRVGFAMAIMQRFFQAVATGMKNARMFEEFKVMQAGSEENGLPKNARLKGVDLILRVSDSGTWMLTSYQSGSGVSIRLPQTEGAPDGDYIRKLIGHLKDYGQTLAL